MSSIAFCLLLSCFTFHLGFVHPLQDVALLQCLPLSSVWFFLIQVTPSFLAMSSCHLLLGRPLDLFPLLGCHSVQRLVHLLSSFLLYDQPISTFVSVCILGCQFSLFFSWFLSMVSYLVALDPTFFSPLLFKRFSVCLSIVYWEIMFGSHRSLSAQYQVQSPWYDSIRENKDWS